MSLHHVGLTVSDLDASIAFYQAALGCRVKERSQSAGAELEALTGVRGASVFTADLDVPGGGWLELIQYASPLGERLVQERFAPGHTHVAFAVADVDAAHARLVALGATPTSAPITIVEPGSVWDGARALYVCDPDGRTIECVELRR
jgi:catechol 2,3-dioxygenase-like lactoylglutathione lyase family enzyme